MAAPPLDNLDVDGTDAFYERAGMTEWYRNGPMGLEQGFELPTRPLASSAGPLMLTLEVTGDLTPRSRVPGERLVTVALVDDAGVHRASYGHLGVTDDEGRGVSAWLTVAPAGRITLVIDDEAATYPLRVDPFVWTEQNKLLANDGNFGDIFGYAVSVSGDTALVGAMTDESPLVLGGSAYTFVRSGLTWVQQAKLLPVDQGGGDNLGYAVSLDGDYALVSARGADTNLAPGGAAYVFFRSGNTWTEQAKLVPGDGVSGDYFGESLALDGDTAIIGAHQVDAMGIQNSGAAYVFVRSGTTWSEQQKLIASDPSNNADFGTAVSVAGDTAVVGAPFGGAGAAYVFVRSGTTWAEQQKLVASDGASEDAFGHAVSLDGDSVLVGSHQDDDNGTNSGSAYVFVRSGTTWTEQQKLLPSSNGPEDNLGITVALQNDRALVGAPNDPTKGSFAGAVYIWDRSGTTWSLKQKLLASDGQAGDQFGFSVSIDGDTAVSGAYYDDDNGTDSGSAFVFDFIGLDDGSACADETDCASGFCVDSVCCESACGGGAGDDCAACDFSLTGVSSGTCAPVESTHTCRAAAGACDAPETCDGVSTTCPLDVKASTSVVCRAANGACDVEETCDGVSDDCPADQLTVAGTECRSSTGECDPVELCDGLVPSCGPDQFAQDGVACTGGMCAQGVCQPAPGEGGGGGEPPSSGEGDDEEAGGCGCGIVGGAARHHGVAWLVVALMALRRRRRRACISDAA